MAKYNYIELASKSKWTEKEMNAFFRFVNNESDSDKVKAVLNALNYNPVIEVRDGISLTAEQNQKAKKWLYNLGFTPKGAERKSNPYGMREEYIVKNFKEVNLLGYYDAGNMWRKYYIPLYEAVGKDGTSMEYYVSGGQIHVIG